MTSPYWKIIGHLSCVQIPHVIPLYWLVKNRTRLMDYDSPQYIQRILTAELIINRPLSMIFPCFDNSTAIRSAIRFLAGRLVNDI